MSACCENKTCDLALLANRHRKVLIAVLAINASMFLVGTTAGLIAGSTALLADSLDMLGDALVYGFSLYVIGRGPVLEAKAALLKAGLMIVPGVLVLAQAIGKLGAPEVPATMLMGSAATAALVANLLCFAMLYRYRDAGLNMRSTWLCSRNDVIASSSVIVAAVLGGAFHSAWPDLLIGLAILLLFMRSALMILDQALAQLRQQNTPESSQPSVMANQK
jgi:Co/Zn/Cd efflux system component